MKFVTLTTDYGTKDYYVSSVKAKLLELNTSNAFHLLDISHEIPVFDTKVAAYQINAWQAKVGFNAIHLIGVDCVTKSWLAVMDRGAFYVMPDNGIISLLDLTEQKQVYQFQKTLFTSSFDDTMVFVSALESILHQGELGQSQDWKKTQNYAKTRLRKPQITPPKEDQVFGTVFGEIIHFDHYGNAITNLHLKHLPSKADLKKVQVDFAFTRTIKGVKRAYSELSYHNPSDYFALFNSQDILEIGIFRSSSDSGGVKELLGLEKEQKVKLSY